MVIENTSFKAILMITLSLFVCSDTIAGVSLTDMGSQVKLDNGIVSATWTKSTAEMISLKHDGDELLGSRGKGYIQQNFDDGSFAIENVRPGTYTLYSNVSGVLDEYELNGITVTLGTRNALGQLN